MMFFRVLYFVGGYGCVVLGSSVGLLGKGYGICWFFLFGVKGVVRGLGFVWGF